MIKWICLIGLALNVSAEAEEATAIPAAVEEIPAAAPALESAAQETPPAQSPAETLAVAPKVAVFLPEQVDGDWYWYDYGAGQQHLAQSAVEKALLATGADLMDVANIGGRISLQDIFNPSTAAAKGREIGADYVIAGKATASKASEGMAYGVTVIRARAEVVVRLVRVGDGKVLAQEEGSAEVGSQAVRTAGQDAIKKAVPPVARKIAAALQKAVAPAPAP